MISQPFGLLWIALYNWKRYPLLFTVGIGGILVNKFIYYYLSNSWDYWIHSAFIGHAFLLMVISAVTIRHKVSQIPIIIGAALLAVFYFGTFGFTWYMKNELSRVGLYCSLFALHKVPAAQIGGLAKTWAQRFRLWCKRIAAEPAHVLFVYGCASAISDIIKVYIGGKMERYLLHTLNPNLFEAMLFAWIIGMYIKRDDKYGDNYGKQ